MAGVVRISQLPVLTSIGPSDFAIINSSSSGALTTYQAAVSTLASALELASDDYVDVMVDFHAVGNGLVDDYAAIQAALDTGRNVYFPAFRYRVDGNLVVRTRGQVLFGPTPTGAGVEAQVASARVGGSAAPVLERTSVNASPLLTIEASQVTLSGISFVGVSRSISGTAVQFRTTSNIDDVDGYMYNCGIINFANAVIHYNRSLNAFNNVIASCGTAFKLIWDATGDVFTNPVQDLPLGNRAASIIDNRLHSVLVGVDHTGAALRSALILNNQLDIGERLFQSDAGIFGCIIANNIADQCSTAPLRFSGGDILDTVISNNRFSGTEGDATNSPSYAIQFVTVDSIKALNVIGNTFADIKGHVILSETGSTTIDGLSIVGNTFTRCALDSATFAAFATAGDVSGLLFTANLARVTAPGLMVNMNSQTLSNSQVYGNVWATGQSLGTYTDGGGNSIQIGNFTVLASNRLGVNTVAPTFMLEVSDTASMPLRLRRTGSSSGVGFSLINDAGDIQLFAIPTGSGGGQFGPGNDDLIGLGRSGFRFGASYLSSVRLGDGATLETVGTGSPEGVVTAAVGSRYWRTDGAAGTRLYFKDSGSSNTGWVAIAAV